MMKKFLAGLLTLCMGIMGFSSLAQAVVLDFSDEFNSGVTSYTGSVVYSTDGGEHIFMGQTTNDDSIVFSAGSTYVNDFQMNAYPWASTSPGTPGSINIEAFDDVGTSLWSTIVDLTSYTTWDNWITVSVETANVDHIVFYATGTFYPSLDNLRINEVPPPASAKVPVHNGLWLIPSVLTGLYLLRRRKA